MLESKLVRISLLWMLALGSVLSPRCQARTNTDLSVAITELTDGSCNLFITETYIIDTSGPVPGTNSFQGALVAITNRGTNVPFQTVVQTGLLGIYAANFSPASNSLGETITLFDGHVSTNFFETLNPVFATQPQSRSVFVGSNVVFTAPAFHCTGYQWQKDGTNLTNNLNFTGVTNATLCTSNLTLDDAGTYTVIAEHPINPLSSLPATLSVFKPVLLSVAGDAPPGAVRILAGNADQSPFDAARVPNVQLYFTTNLTLDVADWAPVTNSFYLTNGVLECDLPTTGLSNGFWQVIEQP
jgi:hypothetical protein